MIIVWDQMSEMLPPFRQKKSRSILHSWTFSFILQMSIPNTNHSLSFGFKIKKQISHLFLSLHRGIFFNSFNPRNIEFTLLIYVYLHWDQFSSQNLFVIKHVVFICFKKFIDDLIYYFISINNLNKIKWWNVLISFFFLAFYSQYRKYDKSNALAYFKS